MKVFLGGTTNGSTWRDELIPKLNINYFNPVVNDWTPECQEEEIKQRQICDIVLYAISKQINGVYSIAEVVDDSNKRPEKTVLWIIAEGLTQVQLKSLMAVAGMVKANGGKVVYSLEDAAAILNNWQPRWVVE